MLIILLVMGLKQLLADQNDIRLNQLFNELKLDKTEKEHKQNIQDIWTIWHEHEDSNIMKWMIQATYIMEKGMYAESLKLLNIIIARDNDFSEAYNKRATLYFMMGKYQDSIIDIEKTLSLEPRHFGALSGMALILIEKEKYRAAIEVYEKIKLITPHDHSLEEKIDFLNQELSLST